MFIFNKSIEPTIWHGDVATGFSKKLKKLKWTAKWAQIVTRPNTNPQNESLYTIHHFHPMKPNERKNPQI